MRCNRSINIMLTKNEDPLAQIPIYSRQTDVKHPQKIKIQSIRMSS